MLYIMYIKINKITKDRLTALGSMNDTYDSVIFKLLDHADKCDIFWSERS